MDQVPDNYPVFTLRLLRRLVEERRIAFSRAGRRIVFSESDIESYLENNRVEPQTTTSSSRVFSAQSMSRVAS
ncbi:MAG: helix-turn-helix domain-containing protein [Acidimicrobiales bacterium]|nr:helix-turn-helix domain-containing protein [Acidimicrobiales bacterium]